MKKPILNLFIASTCALISLLSPALAYSQTNKFPPACPSKQEVQQAYLNQATYNKNTNQYDVQTKKWIESDRNWIISASVPAHSTTQAIDKANQSLAHMKNSSQVKATYLLSQDGNFIFWICTWKANDNTEVQALSMTVRERN